MHRVFDFVKMEAAASGVPVTWSEIVGLVPERALFEAAAQHMQLTQFTPDQVLEGRVREAMSGGQSLSAFVSSIASSAPTPGGGSVTAHAGAVAAALVQMVAGLTVGKKKYAAVDAEMKEIALQSAALSNRLTALVTRDAEAYSAVSSTHQLPQGTEDEKKARAAAIQRALLGAAEVPLETARACVAVAELALATAQRGNQNAVTDAGVAALLAETGCRGAVYNVRVNVTSLADRSAGEQLVREADGLVARVADLATGVRAVVDAALA
jgi:glutamate formiminotransferase/formiminotetrahydrofolate cyclodeaminase